MNIHPYIIFIASFVIYALPVKAETFSQWLSNNESLVKTYISKLEPNDTLEGVTLSNGQTYLAGFVYERQINPEREGSHIHLLSKDERYLAIIWLSSNAKPFEIPECAVDSEFADQPWNRASLISGDVYKYDMVKPGFSLVINYCPSQDWISG